MTDRTKFAALDAEVDLIMNAPEPDSKKPKKQFGLANRNQQLRDSTYRRDTGFGRPSQASSIPNPMRKKPRASWAGTDHGPSFEVSRVSSQRDSSPFYSVTNPIVRQGSNTSSLRPTVPSTRVIPGKALIAGEAKKHSNPPVSVAAPVAANPIYGRKVTNLMTFSRETQPGVRGVQMNTLEACSKGKYWPPKGTVLSPPGTKHKNSRASIASTTPSKAAPSASRRRLSQAHDADDDEVVETRHHRSKRTETEGPVRTVRPPHATDSDGSKQASSSASRLARVDDNSFFLEDKPFQHTMPSSLYDDEDVPRREPMTSWAKRRSGGTAEAPIHLSDSDEEQLTEPSKRPTTTASTTVAPTASNVGVFELDCRCISSTGVSWRDVKMSITKLSLQWATYAVFFDYIDQVLWAKKAPSPFVVVVFKQSYSPLRFIVVQPTDTAQCTALMHLVDEHGHPLWQWRDLYKSLLPAVDAGDVARLRKATKRAVEGSPIVLTYPLPPNATDVISITRADLDRLQPMEYLNDNLVDYYFKWLVMADMPSAAAFCTIVSSHFYTQLRENYANVATWFTNLLDNDLIFIPINLQLHWSLAVVMYPKHFTEATDSGKPPTVIVTIDSMGTYHRKPKIVQNLKKFLRLHSGMDESSNMVDRIHTTKLHGPQQENGYDCGVYMLLATQHILRTFESLRNHGDVYPDVDKLLSSDAFGQSEVDQTRQAMLTNLEAHAAAYAMQTSAQGPPT
ncbi:hypothetical protein, variant 1 [Aphanomyces invadans]|uniref:Ubiquitin-like protease family profile domain-containing protein n=1 Tax=Aphanomyces invadans TaxID=157072 RepID=A0A024UQL7_9STRA|nr:hypothetical protein, variant 1 [Aphanomyces invadans]ETW08152.1 hypothetical protein, variant 1 [Aphanomyces invadans]|eukprot:XP_008864245.1 hypothetical protein, variant 1 [Aphanomyces invadans]